MHFGYTMKCLRIAVLAALVVLGIGVPQAFAIKNCKVSPPPNCTCTCSCDADCACVCACGCG